MISNFADALLIGIHFFFLSSIAVNLFFLRSDVSDLNRRDKAFMDSLVVKVNKVDRDGPDLS